VLIVLKSGSLNLLEPSGPVQACNGIALLFTHFHSKVNDGERGITRAACLYHQHNQSLSVIDGTTVASLSANLQHKYGQGSSMPNHIKLKNIAYQICQIALNQKLSCKFKKCMSAFSCGINK
jgi:predicted ATP-grasp superfamily ATP-dependent carboligase